MLDAITPGVTFTPHQTDATSSGWEDEKMATDILKRYAAKDLRVVANPVGAGFLITCLGKLVGTLWFETAGEARDAIMAGAR
jgi:hypothetical protein